MSRTHDIDNDEPLFQFDAFEPLKSNSLLEVSTRGPQMPTSSSSATPESPILFDQSRSSLFQDYSPSYSMQDVNATDAKGKGISLQPVATEPMAMPTLARELYGDQVDLFSMSLGSAGSSSQMLDPVLSYDFYASHAAAFEAEVNADEEAPSSSKGKGKARELPPSLPPLDFSPTEFTYGSADWPPMAGPSSYDSGFTDAEPSPATSPTIPVMSETSPTTPERPEIEPRIPIRTRSLSNISSRRSISGLSMTNKVKLRFGTSKSSSTLARKLLFKKAQSPPSSPLSASFDIEHTTTDPSIINTTLSGFDVMGQTNCLLPWSRDLKPRTPLSTPVVETDIAWGAIDSFYRAPRPTDSNSLRTKGRSYSSPLPLPITAFDIVPFAPADILSPPPVVVPNYFDEYLPKELRLHIFATLVSLHQANHEKRVQDGKWTVLKASSSKSRWVGRDKGFRELFKLSRVSKSWQSHVFDGQLWAKLDLRSFPKLPPSVLCRLAKTSGGFIREINLSGHAELTSSTLKELTHHLYIQPAFPGEGGSSDHSSPHTHLTSINLQGCTSITTRSLHELLLRSPLLQKLCLKGLTAVTNTTLKVLADHCPKLEVLDVNRCRNMNGEGVYEVAENSVRKGEYMLLKELRMAGLKRVSDRLMGALGRAAPFLEVLDISGARDLHNSSIEAFVSCTEEDSKLSPHFVTVQLTSREAGRDPTDPTRVWRRVTRLRHLNLSACILLTDHACSHLAHAVPKLEYLELAGIGPELRDDGVVRLLNTTPYIRKIDLEDATEISDKVLKALTPTQPLSTLSTPTSTSPNPINPSSRPSPPPTPPEPGHALEHLILSYANINNDSLLSLIRACPTLRTLEADNTRLSGLVLREFVQLSSQSRKTPNAKIVAIDCRGVGEFVIKELTLWTRPRLGWRDWHARKLTYLDGRDEEELGAGAGLGVGQDECEEGRVVVKTFYSWQTVDAVRAVREKKRKAGLRRGLNGSSGSGTSDEVASTSSRARWWSPSGRRSSGPNTPTLLDLNGDREGCTIM